MTGPKISSRASSYLETVLHRGVETATDLRRFDALVHLARLMVARTGTELLVSRLAADVGIDRSTAETYEPWIETTFLVHRVPACSRNLASKLPWSETSARLHHLRESGGLEVDGRLETPDGRIVAVEVKATTVPRADDAAAMSIVRDRLDRLGDDFVAGVVFHTGDRRVKLGGRLLGLPIADVWS